MDRNLSHDLIKTYTEALTGVLKGSQNYVYVDLLFGAL